MARVSPDLRLRAFVLPLPLLLLLAVGACSSDSTTAVLERPASVSTTGTADGSAVTTLAPPATVAATTTMAPATTLASPTGDVFPGADWATADLPAGADRAALDTAVDAAFGAPDAASRVQSIVVVQGGEITYERYHPLDGPDEVMSSYSVAKSFTSAIIGLLVGDGLLDVDERAPIDEWADPTDPRHEITLEHLLHMSSGLQWTEEYSATSQALQMLQAENASAYVASFPLEAEPGTTFDYSTGTTAILAGIAIDTLGGVEEFETYVQQRLFDPLGITSTTLLRDRSGRWFGGLGADHTTRDFARFGLLFLNDGIWDGERILPEGWVDYSRRPSPSNEGYGAQWWLAGGSAFEARGLFGQFIHVDPEHDLVIAINATAGGDSGSLLTATLAALGADVPAAVL
jgi:CubicO group peptidase (beta-lactamase class C family)